VHLKLGRFAGRWALATLILALLTGVSYAKGKTILDYASEIGLTSAQSSKIRETLNSHKRKLIQAEHDLQSAEISAVNGINAGESVKVLRPKLEKSRDCRVVLRFLDIETSRTLEEILTPAQRDSWTKIQNRETTRR
jgi:hypothetical protein